MTSDTSQLSKYPTHYIFLIIFLTLPISISSPRKSRPILASCGTEPSTTVTKLVCAERRAGGTKMPNQRNGSTIFDGLLVSSSGKSVDGSVSESFGSELSVSGVLDGVSSLAEVMAKIGWSWESGDVIVLGYLSVVCELLNQIRTTWRTLCEWLACAHRNCLGRSG
jgi:hypothetical protein